MSSKTVTAVSLFLGMLAPLSSQAQKDVSLWLTNPDKSALFQLQTPPVPFSKAGGAQVITVDDAKTYQTMDGFGFALTGGSAQLISHMDAASCAALLRNLF